MKSVYRQCLFSIVCVERKRMLKQPSDARLPNVTSNLRSQTGLLHTALPTDANGAFQAIRTIEASSSLFMGSVFRQLVLMKNESLNSLASRRMLRCNAMNNAWDKISSSASQNEYSHRRATSERTFVNQSRSNIWRCRETSTAFRL